MQIKKIMMKDFGKHQGKEFKLEPVTLIKGPNGAGKSTIVEGITFGLTGSVRRLPKKLESLCKLSNTDGSLGVRLDTDEGIITRDIVIKNGKPSEVIGYSNCDVSLTNKEKQILIKSKYSLDELLINPANFIALNGADKSKYILSLLNDFGTDAKEVINGIAKAFNNDSFIMEYLSQYNDKLGLIDNLDTIKEQVNFKKKTLSKELKNENENTFKIAELRNQIDLFDSKKSNKIPGLEKEITDLKVQIKVADSAALKFQKEKQELDLLKKNNPTIQKDIALLKKQSQEITKELNELKNFNIDSSVLSEKLKVAQADLFKVKEVGLDTKSKIELITSKIAQIIELHTKISAISKTKRCVIDNSIICNNTFEKANNDLQNEVATLKNQLHALQNERNVLAKQYLQKNKEVEDLSSSFNKALNESKRISNRVMELTTLISNNETKALALNKTYEKIKLLESQLTTVVAEDTSMLKKILATKQNELASLKDTEKKVIELKHNLKLAEVEDYKIEKKNSELELLKALEKRLKSEKLKLLEEGIKPFANKMNEIFKVLDFKYDVFVKNDGKKATIGFIKDKQDIEIDMLSTGETIMFIIGLIGAIYEHNHSDFRLLVLDDLDNLDGSNLDKLFRNADKLTKYFDNILLIGILENINLNQYNIATLCL